MPDVRFGDLVDNARRARVQAGAVTGRQAADIYDEAAYIPDGSPDLRLNLKGEIEAWSDEMPTGIVGHRILRRAGAIHQQPLLPPQKFVFRGVLLGKAVRERYRQMADVVRGHPIGFFVHPRIGWLPAAVEMLSGEETPGAGIDCINYQLRLEESSISDIPRPAAVSYAQNVNSRADSLVTLAEREAPNFNGQAAEVQLAAQGFGRVLSQVTSAAKLVDLQASMRNLQAATRALDGAPFILRVEAVLIFGDAIQAYNRALAGRPSIVRRTVAADIILPRLCAALYGGKLAPAMMDEIRGLNRLPPLLLPSGFDLLLPDPATARRGLATI